ncbi:hypothetical protein MRX96_059370 [Rhipicephalus microplus]
MFARNDKKQAVVRWYDNKPITLMSSIHGQHPQDTCCFERCNKKTKYFCTNSHLFFCITKDKRCFENARTK